MSILMNVRIPTDLKEGFQEICKRKHTYMTTEIIRFMKDFVTREVDQELPYQSDLKSLDRPTSSERNLDTWETLIQNPLTKTWMPKEEYSPHVE